MLYNLDHKWTKAIYTNVYLCLSVLTLLGITLSVLFLDMEWMSNLLCLKTFSKNFHGEIVSRMPYSYRFNILKISIASIGVSIAYQILIDFFFGYKKTHKKI